MAHLTPCARMHFGLTIETRGDAISGRKERVLVALQMGVSTTSFGNGLPRLLWKMTTARSLVQAKPWCRHYKIRSENGLKTHPPKSSLKRLTVMTEAYAGGGAWKSETHL